MNQVERKEPQNKPLYGMFNSIPRRYDLVNALITWGLDKRWRDLAARECAGTGPRRILDLGCGTGDLAINILPLHSFCRGRWAQLYSFHDVDCFQNLEKEIGEEGGLQSAWKNFRHAPYRVCPFQNH